uniref:G protein-coupled receptor n=1 Tax=Actinia sp. UST-01 TaxID=157108 RepID=Q9BIS6_9CNID|nr:G-protein-coupled receptor - sea anemones, actinians [Actiniaria]AAK31203.1 G protein-coupled receptor [Actinia sp. UST-01]
MEQNNTTSFSVTRPSEETFLIWFAPLVVIGVLIVMSNVLTIITFVVNSQLRRRSVYCLMNLAVADALYGAVLTSNSWCVLGVTLFSFKIDFKTRGMFVPMLLTIMGSLLSLVVVCLDRVYATFFPFRHRTARPRVYTFTFIITWSLALFTSLMYHLTPKTKQSFRYFLLVSSCLIAGCYCLINLAAADMMYGDSDLLNGSVTSHSTSRTQYLISMFPRYEHHCHTLPNGFCYVLAVVSMERSFATFFPFRHRISEPTLYTRTFAVVWALAFIVSLLCNLIPRNRPEFKGAVTLYWIFMLSSVLIILLSYLSIFVKVKKHDRQQLCIQRLQHFTIQMQQQRREKSLAITLFIMTMISLLTWIPYLSVRVSYLQYRIYEILGIIPNTFGFVLLIQLTTSLINPFAYQNEGLQKSVI